MDIWEKVGAAQRMQDYIHAHLEEDMALDDICSAALYSKRHALRIFKEIFQKTPFAYIRALRITEAARQLKEKPGDNIVDIAMNTGFTSHEGFTKAFHAYFGVNPNKYRVHNPRRYLYFEPSPVLRYYLLLNARERKNMAESRRTVTVTVLEKPDCRLILKRGVTSTDYFGYCAEIGCDPWEILEEVPGALDRPAFLELPPHLITPGTSKAACALEVPAEFSGDVPEGFEVIDLPRSLMMWFQGAPYEDETWFGEAHSEMYQTIDSYRPEQYGYAFAPDAAPRFSYGTSAEKGCREMLPVRRLQK